MKVKPRWTKQEQKALLNEANWIRSTMQKQVTSPGVKSRRALIAWQDRKGGTDSESDRKAIARGELPWDIRNHFGAPKGMDLLSIIEPRYHDEAVANGGKYDRGTTDKPLYFERPNMEFSKMKSMKSPRTKSVYPSCRDLDDLLRKRKAAAEAQKE